MFLSLSKLDSRFSNFSDFLRKHYLVWRKITHCFSLSTVPGATVTSVVSHHLNPVMLSWPAHRTSTSLPSCHHPPTPSFPSSYSSPSPSSYSSPSPSSYSSSLSLFLFHHNRFPFHLLLLSSFFWLFFFLCLVVIFFVKSQRNYRKEKNAVQKYQPPP